MPPQTAAIFWTFAGVIAIVVAVLVIANEGRHSAAYVFGHFESNSGWPDGWSFFVGLLHAGYATSSTGMIISMCEEVHQPATQVPKAMVGTIVLNTFAGLLFMIPLCFVLPDIQMLINLGNGQPVPTIIKSAVGSSGGAIALLMPLMVLALLCGIGCTTATSRCTWAFARDGAIPGAKWWRAVHPKLDLPLNAMMLAMVIEILLGLIYFGSSEAFNAFSGVGVICLTASYAMPIAISVATGRKAIKKARFSLGRLGLPANIIALGAFLFLLSPAVPLLPPCLFCANTSISVVLPRDAPVLHAVSHPRGGHDGQLRARRVRVRHARVGPVVPRLGLQELRGPADRRARGLLSWGRARSEGASLGAVCFLPSSLVL